VLVQRYYGVGLNEIDAREMHREIMGLIYGLGVELPSRWALLDKALATLAGVGLEIYPAYNVFETAHPYARRIMAERFRPERMLARAQGDVARYAEAVLGYPFQVAEVLEELRDGELRITTASEGLGDAVDRAQATGNRLALALLASALFIGSTLLGAVVDEGPQVLGVAVIAIPGLVAATALGAWLLVGILRSGRW
jgi:ubiquinone biosynthesis protein